MIPDWLETALVGIDESRKYGVVVESGLAVRFVQLRNFVGEIDMVESTGYHFQLKFIEN